MGGFLYRVTRIWVILTIYIFDVNPYSGYLSLSRCYHHTNPKMGKDNCEGILMDYSEIYVKRIRKLCKERGIAINKLAVMSDVKQSTLDNIVRGLTKNPRVKTLHKIALAFNMTLAEFLDFDELNDYSFDDDSDDE